MDCIWFFVLHYRKIAGRRAGSICIGEHYLGSEIAAVIRSRGVTAKQGFLIYCDAIGTKVSVGVVAYQRWSLRGVPLY